MEQKPISRDPKDYSPRVHQIVQTMAKHFFDGDEQKAWEYFFDYYEAEGPALLKRLQAPGQQPARSRISLAVRGSDKD